MSRHIIRRRAEVKRPAVEEHDADVDARAAGGDHNLAQAVEVGRIKFGKVELGLTVAGGSRPGARPRLRCHAQVKAAAGGLRFELLPAPKADEVMAVFLEKRKVCTVVNDSVLRGALGAGPHAIVKVVPDVRAGQVDSLAAGVSALPVATVK